MFKLTPSNLVIVALWSLSLASAAFGTPEMPPNLGNMPLVVAITILVVPIIFFGGFSYVGPSRSPFYHSKLAGFINSRYGAQAYESFLVRLKPLLLFGVTSLLQGTIGLWQNYVDDAPYEAYVISGFFISSGLAFALAHTILYQRKAVGIYPSQFVETHPSFSTISTPRKQPLKVALQLYWWCLIGVFFLPTIMIVSGEIYKIPFEFFAPLFFGVMFLAMWPVLSQRATYSFWLVAMVLWMGGAFMAIFVMRLVN